VLAQGRDNAINGLTMAREHGTIGVLAVIDQDYGLLLRAMINDPDIIVNDDNDIEVTMLKSEAFDHLVRELGEPNKVAKIESCGITVRDFLVSTAHPIGALRLHSMQTSSGLKFKDLSYRFVDMKTFTYSDEEMVREVRNHSRLPNYDPNPFYAFIAEIRAAEHDKWSLCKGHDLTTLFGKSLVRIIGSCNQILVTMLEIEQKLRLAFSIDDFKACNLYPKIKDWEERNSPFVVLRC
jgi:hypothetical protein